MTRRRILMGLGLLASLSASAGIARSGVGSGVASAAPTEQACPPGTAAGGGPESVVPGCELLNGPESPADANRFSEWMQARDAAPFGHVDGAAYARAVAQRNAIAAVPASANANAAWEPVGGNALMASDPNYGPNVDGWGNLAGRTSGYAFDPGPPVRYFESFVDGGVWQSSDGTNWSSIGDNLPTQVIGAIAWSSADGGTLIAGSGDNATGRYSTEGIGIYYTHNNGQSWSASSGIPNGILTFRIAVDPSNASTIYAATSRGLFRSTDGAASFTNVALPLPTVHSDQGDYNCTGVADGSYPCEFANVVSDVVVRTPDSGGTGAGKVLATLGWKYGAFGSRNENTNAVDNTVPQAPQNGV
ncbi:MAG: WD40/YVTN/BNR-like repeat-containing protein, partial [Candidatus Dormibacteria bacterium]